MSETFPQPEAVPEHDWSATFTRYEGKITKEKEVFPEYKDDFTGEYSDEYKTLGAAEEFLVELKKYFLNKDVSTSEVLEYIDYEINETNPEPLSKLAMQKIRRFIQ